MSRIALIEDHERLSSLVNKALSAAGIESDVFERIDSAWSALQAAPYGAIVVDRGLPDGDGLTLVRRLREAGNQVPCLMLTARDALHDRVEGLEAGADDYLVKPSPACTCNTSAATINCGVATSSAWLDACAMRPRKARRWRARSICASRSIPC